MCIELFRNKCSVCGKQISKDDGYALTVQHNGAIVTGCICGECWKITIDSFNATRFRQAFILEHNEPVHKKSTRIVDDVAMKVKELTLDGYSTREISDTLKLKYNTVYQYVKRHKSKWQSINDCETAIN